MIFLIFAIIATFSIIAYCISRKLTNRPNIISSFSGGITVLCAIAIMMFSIISHFIPMEYIDEKEFISSVEITPISIEEKDFCIIDQSNQYYYFVSYKTSNGTQNDKIPLAKKDCIIHEESNCEVPRIEKYSREFKMSFWHLSGEPKIEYDIYIPTGTIMY